jgi:hypothetical protein
MIDVIEFNLSHLFLYYKIILFVGDKNSHIMKESILSSIDEIEKMI